MKKVLKVLGAILLVIALFIGSLFISEYKPQDEETINLTQNPSQQLKTHQDYTLLSFNIGYGALGDNADFFMDGGRHVYTASKKRVYQNLDDISQTLTSYHPDLIYLQEIDHSSFRSHYINEINYLQQTLADYGRAFAYNFKVLFIPYPMPPLGKVASGICTFSRYQIDSAKRDQLPIPFKWPVSVFNLKRGLLVSRMKLSDSDHELVAINLHLEAYDNGEGKIAQTKMLKSIMDEEVKKGNYVIAGGDFNQTFSTIDTSSYPVYENKWQPGVIDGNDFLDDYKMLMDPGTPTCRSLDQPYNLKDPNFQYYMIDGMIVSKNVKVKQLKTISTDFKMSDHNPVLLTFSLE